jgi:hypothetical protein
MADALTESRGLVTVAAKVLGCDGQTVRNYIERFPAVAQAVIDARESLIDSAEYKLAEAIEQRGERWAVTLALRTLGRGRGYSEQSEHAGGADHGLPYSGSVVRQQSVVVVTPETLAEARRQLQELTTALVRGQELQRADPNHQIELPDFMKGDYGPEL